MINEFVKTFEKQDNGEANITYSNEKYGTAKIFGVKFREFIDAESGLTISYKSQDIKQQNRCYFSISPQIKNN